MRKMSRYNCFNNTEIENKPSVSLPQLNGRYSTF